MIGERQPRPPPDVAVHRTLAQREELKAAVLDSVLDSIITMDARGIVVEFNAAAERTFG